MLARSLQRRVASEVDEAVDRNTEAQYLQLFKIDVQVEITKVADNTKVVNLERRSYELAEARRNGRGSAEDSRRERRPRVARPDVAEVPALESPQAINRGGFAYLPAVLLGLHSIGATSLT